MKNYVIGLALGFFVGFSLRGLLEKPPVVHSQGGQGGSATVHGSGFAKGGDGGNTNCPGDPRGGCGEVAVKITGPYIHGGAGSDGIPVTVVVEKYDKKGKRIK